MRTLAAAIASTLLFLAVLAPAPAVAQSSCVPLTDWITDEAGDGYLTDGLDLTLEGGSDLTGVRIGESGATCGTLVIEIRFVDETLASFPDLVDGTLITLDFADAAGTPDWSLEVSYFGSLILLEAGESARLVKDGTVVRDTDGTAGSLTVTDGPSPVTVTLLKSEFAPTTSWNGAVITSESAAGSTAGEPAYTADTASTTEPYLFGFGIGAPSAGDDADGDGLPDSWETDHFGNTTAQNATGDPDHDDLTNQDEYELGTDPNDADTDNGGVEDGNETAAGTDPLDPADDGSDPFDSDNDTLPDAWENSNFGDMNQTATDDPDDDGCDNACEYTNQTDPNVADTDNGGVDDGDEIAAGTDPNDATDDVATDSDTDDDGLNDTWEVEHFTNTTAQNGTDDPDADGCDNECEETNGTDPNDADSDNDGTSDGDEAAAGTDPNDANSAPVEEEDDSILDRLKAETDYLYVSAGAMLAVVAISLIALLGRWA